MESICKNLIDQLRVFEQKIIEDKDKVKFLTSLQELLDTLNAGKYEVNVQYATIKDRYTALVLYSVRED